jgi:MarR family transcriptional regulator, organic hydroperoxide resistance regulator
MGCSLEELGALRERLNSLRNHLIQHVA